jgi:putative transcriptional regulator
METTRSLTSQLLIAMPGMQDPNFATTVTLICEHNDDGALGIIINRPLDLKLGGLFEQLELGSTDESLINAPVLAGGPVGVERGFVLHNSAVDYENSLTISDEIQLTVSRDIIDDMAAGKGPAKSLVALGYAGWEAGQLEAEILANSWINVPSSAALVFDTPFEARWAEAADSLGIDLSLMGPGAGHA